jgi:hypothetical protein
MKDWVLELQKSLNGLRKECPDGFTSEEFGRHMGCSHQSARMRIGELIKAGKVKFGGNRPVKRMDGRNGIVPVYALVKK